MKQCILCFCFLNRRLFWVEAITARLDLTELSLWVPKVLFVQVAVIHLLQNQHFKQTGWQCAVQKCPQGGEMLQQLALCVRAAWAVMLDTSQLHINWTQQFVLMLQIYYALISDTLWEVFQILASFAGWAVSLCALGAAVQTHAKLTKAGTVIIVLYIKTWSSKISAYFCFFFFLEDFVWWL